MSLLHPLPELHLLLSGIHLYLWDTHIPWNPVLFAEFTCKWTKHKDTMIALHDPNLLKLAHESIDTMLLQPPGPYFFCEKAKITFFFFFSEMIKTCYRYQSEYSDFSKVVRLLLNWCDTWDVISFHICLLSMGCLKMSKEANKHELAANCARMYLLLLLLIYMFPFQKCFSEGNYNLWSYLW